MRKNSFEIKSIPETSNIVNQIAETNINKITFNYISLIKDISKIIIYSLDENIVKPLTLFNMCFLIELSLKYYLIRNAKLNVNEVENKGHSIIELMRISKENGLDTDELQFLLQKFRDKDNQRLDLNNYYNYKYNREKGQESLIFDLNFTEKERKNIKDVIECIKKYI